MTERVAAPTSVLTLEELSAMCGKATRPSRAQPALPLPVLHQEQTSIAQQVDPFTTPIDSAPPPQILSVHARESVMLPPKYTYRVVRIDLPNGTSTDAYQCLFNDCVETFVHWRDLCQHRYTHDPQVVCHKCNQVLFQSSFDRHFKRKHKSTEIDTRARQLAETACKLRCTVCHRLVVRMHMAFHQRQHDLEFKCSQCPYSIRDEKTLAKHERKHIGEKFLCQMCDEVRPTWATICKHIREQHKTHAIVHNKSYRREVSKKSPTKRRRRDEPVKAKNTTGADKRCCVQCRYCKKHFHHYGMRLRHEKKEHFKTTAHCTADLENCRETFPTLAAARYHLKTRHSVKKEFRKFIEVFDGAIPHLCKLPATPSVAQPE